MTIALIQSLARENCPWGAERIRGELLKLDSRVAKRTTTKQATITPATIASAQQVGSKLVAVPVLNGLHQGKAWTA